MRSLALYLLLASVAMGGGCATATQSKDGGQPDRQTTDQQSDGPRDAGVKDGKADKKKGDVKAADLKLTDSKPPDVGKPDKLMPDILPTPDVVSPDLKAGKICNNGKDDDGDGKVDCIDTADCGKKKPCLSSSRTLVIHEVSTGSPNYVVLRNASNTWRSMGGWKLEMSGSATTKFNLPVKSLAPGATVLIVEYSGKTGEIGTGANIPFNSGTSSSHNNSVLLRSPGNAVVDYVGFGKMLVNIPGTVNQVGGPVPYKSFNPNVQAYYRAGMKGDFPTFQASDWHKYKRSR